MLMKVSALVSLATIENMTAHQGIAPSGDEVVLRVLLLPADVQSPSAVRADEIRDEDDARRAW